MSSKRQGIEIEERPGGDAGVQPATAPQAPPEDAPGAPVGEPKPRWPWFAAVAAVFVAVLSWYFLRSGPTTSNQPSSSVAVATRADFVRTLRLHGTTEAVSFHTVMAPQLRGAGDRMMVVTSLVAAGSKVKKGDLLVEFDRQLQAKNALDREAEYQDLVAQIQKKQAEQAAAEALDRTNLTAAENAVQSAELEMRRNEVVSAIDAEKNRQNLEEAKARLAQLRETLELKRRAALADLKILEIQRDKARSAMEHAQANAEKMVVRSPIDGVVVLNSIWKGGSMGEVQVGDEVRPGTAFMQVVDPSKMQVRAKVNQLDMPGMRVGLPVKVGLDAYPELSFEGRIERIAAVGSVSSLANKVRTFMVIVSIEGAHDRLMPDLSASLDVELERMQNALVVPRDAVLVEDGRAFVRVKSGPSSRRREVKLRQMSDVEAVIEEGVEEGATVLRGAAAEGQS